MRILITGASGLVGKKLVEALEPEHELRLLSRTKRADDPRWRQVDIRDFHQMKDVAEGMDAVIHLAKAPGHEGDYEDDAFNEEQFDTNVRGAYNVFEAARRAGVARVIYTSSLTVVWGYPSPTWVEGDAPARPVGTYALTKHLGEQIAVHYARAHGLSVLCLRIPKPIDIDDPESRKVPILPQWIAFPDLIQAYRRALTVPDLGFEVVTIAGESSKRRWDLSRAEQVLGYRPRYRLEDLGYSFREEPEDYGQGKVVFPE